MANDKAIDDDGDNQDKIINLMLELEKELNIRNGSVCVCGVPPITLNAGTFARLENGTLYPNQSGARMWGMTDLANLVGFLARDWRDY